MLNLNHSTLKNIVAGAQPKAFDAAPKTLQKAAAQAQPKTKPTNKDINKAIRSLDKAENLNLREARQIRKAQRRLGAAPSPV